MLRCCWRPVVQLGRPYIPCGPYRRYHPPPRTKKPPLSTGPLAELHAFLAPTNIASKEPALIYSSKALHKLYLAVKALPPRKKGYPLNCYELDQLLVLFGSLSLPPPRPKSIFIHSLASRIPASGPFRPYWSLVLELAEQIRVRPKRKPRTGAHHYWVMRAHLARMRGSASEIDNDPADEATARYIRIRTTPDPEVHIPYLRTMLALRRSTHLLQIVNFLCRALETQSYATPDHRFAALLWQIVLGADASTPRIQGRVLTMLWMRLRRHPYATAPHKPLHVFDAVSKTHIPAGVTIPQLCAALATALFPHFRMYVPEVVSCWAAAEAKEVFHPRNAAPARWANLVVLALYAAPGALSSGTVRTGADGTEDAEPHVAWRTVFSLAVFERTVPHDAPEPVRTAVRRLWRTWRTATELDAPPLVRRVVVAAFLRLAARTRDGPLKDGCARYCAAHGLWGTQPGETKWDVVQTTKMFVDYVYAALHIDARPGWQEIFAALPPDSPAVQWRARVADALLRAFLPQDVAAAQELYAFCEQHGLAISSDSVLGLGLVLAEKYYPDEALGLLGNVRFSADQMEELLDCVMRTLRRERHAFKDIQLANVIAPVMQRLYIHAYRTPKNRTKYSLRYALSVLAASDRPVLAAALLRTIHARQPDFFSIHYFLRTMRTLVKHRRIAAVGLLQLVQRFPAPARQNFWRKLTLRLARTGAHTLAARAYRFGGKKGQPRTAREALARAVRFRVNMRDGRPPKLPALKIVSLMARRPRDAPTVRYGVALLTRVGRMRAAKHMVNGAHEAGLGGAVLTRLGNTVLNGALHRTKSRHARVVRHVLRNREQLEERVDFVQDRVTVNILVKVLLRWKTFMNAGQIRRLFDHMVRNGYPAPARWRKAGGVPFGTPVGGAGANAGALNMLKLSPFISFERHVRPLYRMFVKALQLQGDAVGARTVVGILHDVEDEVLLQRHVRRRARLAGILRKQGRI
ncbi:hypothetical protein MVEN_02485400 [Mycena venus]|uniref:Uncharacterized protein n=1 Tax=Mycena venus TaxID=2733690 RepID=A0A8H7CCH4_9AGAR|nr:hypothetical protein MVEN_02485400 [Mycena venus]